MALTPLQEQTYLRSRRVRNNQNPFNFLANCMESAFRSYQGGYITSEELQIQLAQYESTSEEIRQHWKDSYSALHKKNPKTPA